MYDDPHPSIPLVRLIGGLSLHYGGRRMALPSGSHRLPLLARVTLQNIVASS